MLGAPSILYVGILYVLFSLPSQVSLPKVPQRHKGRVTTLAKSCGSPQSSAEPKIAIAEKSLHSRRDVQDRDRKFFCRKIGAQSRNRDVSVLSKLQRFQDAKLLKGRPDHDHDHI